MTLIEILESREEALKVPQVAELLGVSDRHIYELIADGTLPAFRVGKAVRIDPQDLADWLRRKKPLDEGQNPRKPQKHDRIPPSRKGRENASPVHVWRNKINSLEAALATQNLSDKQ